MKKSYLLLLALFWLPSVYVYSLDVILTKARMQIQCNIVSQDEHTVTYQLLDSQDKELYTIGRSENSDIIIKDEMLSRINCFIYFNNGIWSIQDGNQEGEYSTNGTWLYAFEDTEITDNMVFKSNKFNFCCKFSSSFK